MSETSGGTGAPGGTPGATSGGTGAPGGGTGAPGGGTGAPASAPASSPAVTPGERISLTQATAELTKRRRDKGAPDQPRRRAAPARADATLATLGATPQAALTQGAADKPPAAPEGGDVLDRLMREMASEPAPKAEATPPAGETAPAPDAGAVTLQIGGKPQSFTSAQLVDHIERASDYTRKAQQLAAFTREVQAAQQAVAELMPIITPLLEQQIKALEGSLGDEPDWVALATADPAKYNIERAKWDMAERERRKLQVLKQQQTQQTEAQQKAQLAAGHKVLTTQLPGWEKPEMRGRIQQELVKWGRANGYPDAELRSIYEPRYVIALTKAMMFDRMMAGAKSSAPVIPVVQRGSLPAPQTESVQTAETNFAQKPSVRNAAQLLSARRAAARGNGRER